MTQDTTTKAFVLKDDRTAEERDTHTCFVRGRDIMLSGWGLAADGRSIAVWACRPEHLDTVYDWVESREDMRSVTTAWSPDAPNLLRGDHCQIYVVHDQHPALSSEA